MNTSDVNPRISKYRCWIASTGSVKNRPLLVRITMTDGKYVVIIKAVGREVWRLFHPVTLDCVSASDTRIVLSSRRQIINARTRIIPRASIRRGVLRNSALANTGSLRNPKGMLVLIGSEQLFGAQPSCGFSRFVAQQHEAASFLPCTLNSPLSGPDGELEAVTDPSDLPRSNSFGYASCVHRLLRNLTDGLVEAPPLKPRQRSQSICQACILDRLLSLHQPFHVRPVPGQASD